ncbi:MAG: hypothetical protein KJI69_05920 [Patescibacteria group bacterium]|nr:hypothetical protein [Patescibacteria group bacterium]
MAIDMPLWITILSAATGWLAAAVSIYSAVSSSRSAKLSRLEAEHKHPHLATYISDAFVKHRTAEADRIFAYCLLVSNHSDTDNSLSRLALVVSYRRPDSGPYSAEYAYDQTLAPAFEHMSLHALQLPSPIPAHQSISDWAFFKIKDVDFADAIIDSFTLRAYDTHSKTFELGSVVVREILDEKELASRKD